MDDHAMSSQDIASKDASPEPNVDSIIEQLQGCSPLQLSKKLIDIELFDKKSSLDVLHSLHKEMESQDNVMDKLVEPIFFNIIDSTIHHPKLQKYFTIGGNSTGEKKCDDPGTSIGITPSRVIKELKSFSYDVPTATSAEVRFRTPEEELLYQSKREYGDYNFRDNTSMGRYRESVAKQHSHSNYCEVAGRVVKKQSKQAKTAVDVDHIIPGQSTIAGLASIPLSDIQRKQILNRESNFVMMESSDNRSKGDSSGTQYMLDEQKQESRDARQKGKSYSTEDKVKIVARDANALSMIAGEAAVLGAANQTKSKAIGDLIILAIKPLFFEITDILKNGVKHGLDADSFSSALRLRFKRVMTFYKKQIMPFIKEAITEFFDKFITNFFTALGGIIISLLSKSLGMIVKGFKAIVEAVRIAFSSDPKYTPAQKGDAILKLLSTTIITLVIEHFSNQIMAFLNGTPFDFISDIATIIVSGIASTFVVYFLDKIDLFSSKYEKLTLRVNEVFDLRIAQIKENTDAFEATALAKLAEDRLQFRSIAERIDKDIAENKDVNAGIYMMSDFLKIDLQIKSTDSFLKMLAKNDRLVVE